MCTSFGRMHLCRGVKRVLKSTCKELKKWNQKLLPVVCCSYAVEDCLYWTVLCCTWSICWNSLVGGVKKSMFDSDIPMVTRDGTRQDSSLAWIMPNSLKTVECFSSLSHNRGAKKRIQWKKKKNYLPYACVLQPQRTPKEIKLRIKNKK